ncbi:MAG TPA: lipopolysaccharide transport periplasmic protein LptA [Xanthomonadaceae bacterium]|nr:lipopolysaccharide transport periplasmic protein LptA [Xanthomonadaceae bacterium]
MNPMPRAAKLALATLLLLPLAALAKTSDRDQPMTVDAASQSGSMLDDNGTIHYAGNVVIVQGSLEVHADAADLYRKNGDIERIVLTGKQATLKQQMDDGTWMNGRADTIEYQAKADTIVLTGNYKVDSPKGSNAGQRMVYNTKTGNMESGGDGTRVHTVIQPKNKTAAPAPQGR